MTEQKEADAVLEVEPKQKKQGSSAAFIVALLAILMQGGFLGYYFTQPQTTQDSQDSDMQDVKAWHMKTELQLSEQKREFKKALKDVLERLDVVEGRSIAGAEEGEVLLPNIETQLDELYARIEQLEEQTQSQQPSKDVRDLALQLAFHTLQKRLNEGQPFVMVLEAVRRQLPADHAAQYHVNALKEMATRGVRPLPVLQQKFATLRENERAATSEGDGFWQGVKQNISSLVKVRKIGDEHDGDDNGSVVARAQAKLNAGDIEGAVTELVKLDNVLQEHYLTWIGEAGQTMLAHKELKALETAIILQIKPAEK